LANAVVDLDTVVEIARRDLPGHPVFMLGHSMGGAIALEYALAHQDKLAGLVLSAPAAANEAPAAARVGARIASRLVPRAPVHKLDVTGISRDPDEVRSYQADPLVDDKPMRARTVGELVAAFGRFPDALPRLTIPLLVMHGTGDRLTSVAGSKMIAQRAGSADKELRLYDGFYHELINEPEPDRERIMGEIVAWLDAHTPS
jgi:lysophospholipase